MDTISPERRSENMRRIRGKDTAGAHCSEGTVQNGIPLSAALPQTSRQARPGVRQTAEGSICSWLLLAQASPA
jgi:hypothetical protein